MPRKSPQPTNRVVPPVCERMRELRLAHGRSQEDCAELLEVKQNTYSRIETGIRHPTGPELITLARFYGLKPEEAFPSRFGNFSAAG